MKHLLFGQHVVERFREFDSTELFVVIMMLVMYSIMLSIIIMELVDMRKMQRGYIVDKSFLKMEERCGESLDKEIEITVINHYATNFICDI